MSPIVDLTEIEGLIDPQILWEVTFGGYRYELFSHRRVLVYKGEATKPSYEITHSGCNCPSALYGNHPCKHEAPLVWKGDGAESVDVPLSNDDEASDILSNLLS